jgi:hypothetical protein
MAFTLGSDLKSMMSANLPTPFVVKERRNSGRVYQQQRTHGHGSIRQQQQARWVN